MSSFRLLSDDRSDGLPMPSVFRRAHFQLRWLRVVVAAALLVSVVPDRAAFAHADPPGPPPITTWAGLWDLTLTDAEFKKQDETFFRGLEFVIAYTWSIGAPHVVRNAAGGVVGFGSSVIGQSTPGSEHGISFGSPLVFFMHDECWQIDALALGAKVVESDVVFFKTWLERVGLSLGSAAVGLFLLPSPDPASKGSAVTALVLRGMVGVMAGLLGVDGNDDIGELPPQVLAYKEARADGTCPPEPNALTELPNIDANKPSFGWYPIVRDPSGTAVVTAWLRTTGCYMCDGAHRVAGICKGPAFGSVPFDCVAATPTPKPVTSSPDRRTSMVFEPLENALAVVPQFSTEDGNPGQLSAPRLQRLQEVSTDNTVGLADFMVALAIQQNLGLVGIADAIDALHTARASDAVGDVDLAMQSYRNAFLAAAIAHSEGELGVAPEDFDVAVFPAAMTLPAGRSFPAMGLGFGVSDDQIVLTGRASPEGDGIGVEVSSFERGVLGLDVSVAADAAPGDHTVAVEMTRACAGSCRGGGVSIADLVTGVNIALGRSAPSTCDALDTDRDGAVSIAELVRAVRASLAGCFVPGGETVSRDIVVSVVDIAPQVATPTVQPTATPPPTPTPVPAQIFVGIQTERGCGGGAVFVPGEVATLGVAIDGTPTGRPVSVSILARVDRKTGSQTVGLFQYDSAIGQTSFRNVTYEASDANATLTFFVEVRADRVVAQDQCRTTVGSIVQPTPLPTPPSECGGGLVCDPEIVGMTCRLLCPFGPPVEGTCQTTGIGCRCFGACL